MELEITTKDLMAMNELMTFENWIAIKMRACADCVSDDSLKTMFKDMAKKHYENHKKLHSYLEQNFNDEGGKK